MFIYAGDELARYGFGEGHPLGPDRFYAFWNALQSSDLITKATIKTPIQGHKVDALLFHTADYVQRVQDLSEIGEGMLDSDTPVIPGIFTIALTVVGTVLDAIDQIMHGNTRQAFVPIAGLHHASRSASAGFCVFNDCGIAIEALRQRYATQRILYIDIDAHHANGVFYAFEEDPDLFFIDVHEDGGSLYPGTGSTTESGKGSARGTKLNIPLPPGATDELFFSNWSRITEFMEKHRPEFIIFQCGADSLAGDPITHMQFSTEVHFQTAKMLQHYAKKHCHGRILALGGGGYNHDNIANAWAQVIRGLLCE
ncbi:acetoin utilization protein AcuC [Sedimenticola selenatireducens]|uniref:Acetoin utilization protein AcuC n=1 Tax=Sedimenticola selenatireducens TaxID=191960 RepID=A0A557SMN8_9GAMM|nr:acetoin utilization protein AcuC [Sedimenticola selenatireducens]TVO78688.1 acetoin utilization protein AcuC [Sedimenticola selenatireducens]TVT62050.1 MAG: acetoin utilization protein AcuC [Sedimenticola selenatireducens]